MSSDNLSAVYWRLLNIIKIYSLLNTYLYLLKPNLIRLSAPEFPQHFQSLNTASLLQSHLETIVAFIQLLTRPEYLTYNLPTWNIVYFLIKAAFTFSIFVSISGMNVGICYCSVMMIIFTVGCGGGARAQATPPACPTVVMGYKKCLEHCSECIALIRKIKV